MAAPARGAVALGGGPDDPFGWGVGPDALQGTARCAVVPGMSTTTTSTSPARAAGALQSPRILRRAQGAALVSEPRLQLAFDRSTGIYALAML